MSQLLLIYALVAAQVLLVLAIGCGAARIFRGREHRIAFWVSTRCP